MRTHTINADLKRAAASAGGKAGQERTHSAAATCLAAFAGGDPRRAEKARAAVRARLAKRRVR